MKTKIGGLITICILVLASLAFTILPVRSVQQAPLVLPDWAQLLIYAGIGWVITQGLKSLSKAIPNTPDLSGVATALTGAFVTAIVVFGNALLAMIPAESQAPVAALFGLLAAILSAYGIAGTVKSFQTKP